MKIRIYVIIFFMIIIFTTFLGCDYLDYIKKEKNSSSFEINNNKQNNKNDDNTEDRDKQSINLGYCPTMKGYAETLKKENDFIIIMPFDSTSSAFNALNNNVVDIVLVGRIAEEYELKGAFEKRLREGFTLVGNRKRAISFKEIESTKIHTAEDKEIIKEYGLENSEIIFHESLEDALREGIQEIVFINWNNYSKGMQLVIPINSQKNKIEQFRLPVLYSYNDTLIERI
jgi:hypothetical protein